MWNRSGVWKVTVVQSTKAVISLKMSKIERQLCTTDCLRKVCHVWVIDWYQSVWPWMTSKRDSRFSVVLLASNCFSKCGMSTATKSIKRNKQLPQHCVSIEIYSSIAQFPYDSMAFLRYCTAEKNKISWTRLKRDGISRCIPAPPCASLIIVLLLNISLSSSY